MLKKVFCSAVFGIEATTVTVEVNVDKGIGYHLVGLPDNAIKESNFRIAAALQNNLLSFLAAGAGPPICARHVRAAMALRANVLLQGKSGVRFEIIDRLIRFLQADAIPIVRELGSIGASGDLIPLSTIARAIPFTIHNDAPVVPPDVMRLVQSAVDRKTRSGHVLGAVLEHDLPPLASGLIN